MRLFFLKIIAYIWLFFRKERVIALFSVVFTLLAFGVGALISLDRSTDQNLLTFNFPQFPNKEVAGVAIAPSPSTQPVAQDQSSTVLGPDQPDVLTTKKLADIRPVISPSPTASPKPSPSENNSSDSASQGTANNDSSGDSNNNSNSDSTPEPTSTPKPDPTTQPSQTPEPTSTPSPTQAPNPTSEPAPSNPPDSVVQQVVDPILP